MNRLRSCHTRAARDFRAASADGSCLLPETSGTQAPELGKLGRDSADLEFILSRSDVDAAPRLKIKREKKMEGKGMRCVAKTMDLRDERKINRTDGEGVQWAFCSALVDVDRSL